MLLVIYVDDFKLAGLAHVLPDVWKLLRKGIRMDDPTPLGKHAGCDHIEPQRTRPETGASLHVLECDMSSFLQSRVDRYLDLAGLHDSDTRGVQTPFLHEEKEQCPARDVCLVGSSLVSSSSVRSSGSCQVGKSQFPHHGSDVDTSRDRLQPLAARVLMKILHAARVARYDLSKQLTLCRLVLRSGLFVVIAAYTA